MCPPRPLAATAERTLKALESPPGVAEDEARTRDIDLGRIALHQLRYPEPLNPGGSGVAVWTLVAGRRQALGSDRRIGTFGETIAYHVHATTPPVSWGTCDAPPRNRRLRPVRPGFRPLPSQGQRWGDLTHHGGGVVRRPRGCLVRRPDHGLARGRQPGADHRRTVRLNDASGAAGYRRHLAGGKRL